ncbi:Alcohol dehydrogenase class-3 [Wickerhamomyces ciferrii]|uniref:Alcohol dehydrogenase class-3 n=1 Tax=Wickerhamomyces ciferrii (strain ATCC 14091 / BCRC 22168 / CBS 111 / JCM 3599 / NBRC 0793 / NRRL Y-1031 F-60-10) TaxID=1206466 RepID=K0KVP1_WICCF|nr:Alcohol dehydrogenase class-3 [Wickerhamomyces ciferrii]CCH45554.1 Alcohol dehydrogenase class-3 [Wickerhamomyces ciferrii]
MTQSTKIETTKNIEIKDINTNKSISKQLLKRKLSDLKDSDQSTILKNLNDRTLSISSTDSEDLGDRLDQNSSSSSSDEEDDQVEQKRKLETDEEEPSSKKLKRSDSQTAVVIKSFDEPFFIDNNYPIPKLNDYEVLIENKYIGLNPVDWKGKKYRFGVYSFPWIQGRESSGVVHQLGPKVDNVSKGDEVFIASTSYRDLRTSTFQNFTIFDSRLIWKLPEVLSLKESCAIGVGLITAGSVIEELNVNLFDDKDFDQEKLLKKRDSILIWGGSSGVGSYIIQLAKVAGFKKIITVASEKHNEFLTDLGATHILDRFKSKDELIKELTDIVPEGLQIGVDVVGKQTTDIVLEFLNINRSNPKESPKTFVGVVSKPSKDIDESLLENIELKEVFIKKFHENVKFGEGLVSKTWELLSQEKIKPQRNLKIYKGFEGILDGLKDLEKFGASNEKYIVEL